MPNAPYRMIMWYFRNIVYWLIPANRLEPIWWKAVLEIAKRPQLNEELGTLREAGAYKTFGFEHYLYFGQLAERYFEQARGHCASYIVHEYIFKPKIPWWEWIQEIVDVWDPVQKARGKEVIRREQWLGAIGAALRPEITAQLALGAAIVAAASVQSFWAKVPSHRVRWRPCIRRGRQCSTTRLPSSARNCEAVSSSSKKSRSSSPSNCDPGQRCRTSVAGTKIVIHVPRAYQFVIQPAH